jgi:hypothetical protein
MPHANVLTAADLRAAIARKRVPIYVLAARVSLHPSHLSQVLNERVPLTKDLSEKIIRVLAGDTDAAVKAP